jgi:hypothetical protein
VHNRIRDGPDLRADAKKNRARKLQDACNQLG